MSKIRLSWRFAWVLHFWLGWRFGLVGWEWQFGWAGLVIWFWWRLCLGGHLPMLDNWWGLFDLAWFRALAGIGSR